MMALGDPLQTMTLARLADPQVTLAAVGVIKAVANLLESPIIMVLHASTALSAQPASRRALGGFVLGLSGLLTAMFLLLAVPPIYGWMMRDVFGVEPAVAGAGAVAFLLMAGWPAVIAWRRYYQGILIRRGAGRFLGRASVGRLLAVSGILAAGLLLHAPGTLVAATALMGGILAEALLVTYHARHCPPGDEGPPPGDLPESVTRVASYYAPLAGTMLLVWGGRAALVAVISHAIDGTLALAAWAAGWGFVLLVSNATRMVQQIVISCHDRVGRGLLLRFAAVAGLLCCALLALLAFTGPGQGVLLAALGGNREVFGKALPVVQTASTLPVWVALQNALQGFHIVQHRNWTVQWATLAGLVVTLGTAVALCAHEIPGATAGAAAILTGILTEVALLAGWRR
ncbi:MAG: hypothetical protein AB1758_16380 [Candidatus Eremiobacterota bacterium]